MFISTELIKGKDFARSQKYSNTEIASDLHWSVYTHSHIQIRNCNMEFNHTWRQYLPYFALAFHHHTHLYKNINNSRTSHEGKPEHLLLCIQFCISIHWPSLGQNKKKFSGSPMRLG